MGTRLWLYANYGSKSIINRAIDVWNSVNSTHPNVNFLDNSRSVCKSFVKKFLLSKYWIKSYSLRSQTFSFPSLLLFALEILVLYSMRYSLPSWCNGPTHHLPGLHGQFPWVSLRYRSVSVMGILSLSLPILLSLLLLYN